MQHRESRRQRLVDARQATGNDSDEKEQAGDRTGGQFNSAKFRPLGQPVDCDDEVDQRRQGDQFVNVKEN